MGYTAIAIVVGLAAGLLAGGRPGQVAERSLRWWPALAIGATAQWVPELLDVPDGAALAAVLASYALLAAFGLANLALVGMPVVLVGLALNIVVITANAGMPVRPSAVVAAGLADDVAEAAALDYGAKRHVEGPDERLTVLGDVIPVRPLGEVLSFGDLILAAGVADVVFRLLHPARARRRADEADEADEAVSVPERVGTLARVPEPRLIDLAAEERRTLSSSGA